jgi:hypothetical protein
MSDNQWDEVVNLTEYADCRGRQLKVDREHSTINDVKLIGINSANGRSYVPEALLKARPMYEGAKVNLNHHSGQRTYQDRIGAIRNVRFQANEGLFGDFQFNPKHALAEQLIWDAEHAPENLGFSHNADGRINRKAGKVFVEEIIGVRSVDLVADPATTKSLFESLEAPNMAKEMQTPVASIGSVTDMILGEVREILESDGEAATKASQIGKIAKALLKVEDQIDAAMNGKSTNDGASAAAQTQESKQMLDELNAKIKELQDHNNLLESKSQARAMLEEAKVEVNDVRIDAVVAATTPEAKKALVESWPVKTLVEEIRPRSGGKVGDWKPPADPKETAKRLKSRR